MYKLIPCEDSESQIWYTDTLKQVLWAEWLYSLELICWRLNPQCAGICRWSLWRGIMFGWGCADGVPVMGFLSLGSRAFSFFAFWVCGRKAVICKLGERIFPRICIYQYLGLGLTDSRTVRNHCVLFKPLGVWHFVTTAWAKTTGLPDEAGINKRIKLEGPVPSSLLLRPPEGHVGREIAPWVACRPHAPNLWCVPVCLPVFIIRIF